MTERHTIGTSPNVGGILPALAKMREDIPTIPRDAKNPHFGSEYASLDAILTAVWDAAHKHGIYLTQSATLVGGGPGESSAVEVVTRWWHVSTGQWVETTCRVGITRFDPQASGAAITYARRYGLGVSLGLVTEHDDDAESATPRTAPGASPTRHAVARAASPAPATPAATTARPKGPTDRFRVIPFGRTKGTPFEEVTDSELVSAYEWARDHAKFTEFQDAAVAELLSRGIDVATTAADEEPF